MLRLDLHTVSGGSHIAGVICSHAGGLFAGTKPLCTAFAESTLSDAVRALRRAPSATRLDVHAGYHAGARPPNSSPMRTSSGNRGCRLVLLPTATKDRQGLGGSRGRSAATLHLVTDRLCHPIIRIKPQASTVTTPTFDSADRRTRAAARRVVHRTVRNLEVVE